MNVSIVNIFILIYLITSIFSVHVLGCGSKRISCISKTSYKFCFMAGKMVMEIGNVKYCPKDSVCSENEGTVPCLQLTKIEELEMEYIPVASTDSSHQEVYLTTPIGSSRESTTYTPFVTTVTDISKQGSSFTTLDHSTEATTAVTEFSNTLFNYTTISEEYETGLLTETERISTVPTLQMLKVDTSTIAVYTETSTEDDPILTTTVEDLIEAPSTVAPSFVIAEVTTKIKDTFTTEKETPTVMKETTANTVNSLVSPSNKYIFMDSFEENLVYPESTQTEELVSLRTNKPPDTEFQETDTTTPKNLLKTETSPTSQWVLTTLTTSAAGPLNTKRTTNIFGGEIKQQGYEKLTTMSSTTSKEPMKLNFSNNQNTINNYFFMLSYILNTTTPKAEQLRNEAISTEVNVVTTKPSDKMVSVLTSSSTTTATTLSTNKEPNNAHIWRREDTSNSGIDLLTPNTKPCTENKPTTSTTTVRPLTDFRTDFSTTRNTFSIFPYTRVSRPICFGTGKYPSEVCNKYYECVRIMWWFQLRIRSCRLGQSFNPVTLTCQRDNTCWGTFY